MSQQPSSVKNSQPRQVSEAEMRALLRQYFAEDARPGLVWELSHRLRDPFTASKDGRFRLSPLWLALGTLASLALSVFLYFTFWT
jgi:hypothetical protein